MNETIIGELNVNIEYPEDELTDPAERNICDSCE